MRTQAGIMLIMLLGVTQACARAASMPPSAAEATIEKRPTFSAGPLSPEEDPREPYDATAWLSGTAWKPVAGDTVKAHFHTARWTWHRVNPDTVVSGVLLRGVILRPEGGRLVEVARGEPRRLDRVAMLTVPQDTFYIPLPLGATRPTDHVAFLVEVPGDSRFRPAYLHLGDMLLKQLPDAPAVFLKKIPRREPQSPRR